MRTVSGVRPEAETGTGREMDTFSGTDRALFIVFRMFQEKKVYVFSSVQFSRSVVSDSL